MSKLAIIGLGHVGSAVLAQAMAMNLASEIVCIDINEKVAHGNRYTYSARYESLFR